MTMRWRLAGTGLGLLLLFHGLAHAVLPMRAADILGLGVIAPVMTAMYVVAIIGFVTAGLGVLGVGPLRRVVTPVVLVAGLSGLGAQVWYREESLWLGVMMSLILPLLAVLHVQTSPPPVTTRTGWRRLLDAAALAFLAWVAASAVLWPWHRAWGTEPHEWALSLPGDPTPRTPQFEVLHAVTIDAAPADVWLWLVQLGHDRAGFYSYDWLERAFMVDIHNVEEVRPEWQTRRVGERVYATQAGYLGGLFGERPGWTVSAVDPQHALVLQYWGAFVLLPTASGDTRFLIRSTMSNERIPAWAAALNLAAFQLPHFIMQRKMMLTIKRLAEGRQMPA